MSAIRDQAGSEGFLKIYQQSLGHLERIAEDGKPFKTPERTPERLVAAVWFDQQLDHDNLRLADGRKLKVISPGQWNQGSGPDFRGARLRLAGGPTLDGDAEVHVFASDWDRHGHAEDPRYDRVVLRVCMWNDLKKPGDGGAPLLEMFPYLADARILASRDEVAYPHAAAAMRGRCAPLVDERRLDKALRFIAAAGDARIQSKSARMGAVARAFGYDQTLYKGLLEAAGYSANKEPLSRLADLLHLDLLRSAVAERPLEQRRQVILALLYGCSGFFDTRRGGELPAPLRELESLWSGLRSQAGNRFVVVRGIKLARTRPANNPFRRLAALSHLLCGISGLKLFDYFLAALGNVERPTAAAARDAGVRLRRILTNLSDPFWDRHLSATGAALQRPQKLIGDGLAATIVVNILIPLMLAFARRQQHWNLEVFLHQLLCGFGGQPHNALTRFACSRIFGPDRLQPRFAANARLHQGLLQVYHDFCRSLRQGCEECDLVDFLVEEGF